MKFANPPRFLLALGMAIGLANPLTLLAHGGEDHGAPPPPVSVVVAPRAIASSEEFEVVAVLADKKLVIYLDQFATNEPVVGAKVDVDGAGIKGIGEEVTPGIYRMPVNELPAGRYPLTIAIETADSADLLTTTFDTTEASAGVVHVHTWGERTIWGAAGLIVLASTGLLLWHRRQSRRPHQ